MSREIKFRAMTKANNVMVFGDLIVCPNGEHRILWFEMKGEIPLDVDYKSFNEPVQSSTIGQYTGLKDKNGREIYEDDILTYNGVTSNGSKILRKVNYNSENASFQSGMYLLTESIELSEIIGNIYENPELLTI